MVWVTAALVALGGLFGGLNTLYAAFAARVREFATLQTLGFSRLAVLISLVQEAVLVTAGGALLAALLAILFLNGVAVRFSMGSFGLVVDAPVVAAGLLAGVGLGVLGALPPAWRCLRIPVKDALRTA
jgi:ABC-type antimicrobial peptide transport system permease subunit